MINSSNRKFIRNLDFIFLLITFSLIIIGLFFVYSATYRESAIKYATLKKQITWVVFGLIIMIGIMIFDYRKLKSYVYPIYAINIILLISVFLIGKESLGAQRWIPLGSFVFQPSEISKILIIITLAAFLTEKRENPLSVKDFMIACFHIGVPLLLIFKQPDLGTSLVFIAILLGTMFFSGMNVRYMLALVVLGVVSGAALIKFNLLADYQLKRLLVFIDPGIDPLGAGYNLIQSQIAVGSGGIFGKGLFAGTQSGLNFLPHPDTDFIFSVIGEEWGFLGSIALLVLFLAFFSRAITIALRANDNFGSAIIGGIVSMIFFQTIINLGMTIGVMPITGIPLPFISYGGSAMMTNLISVGLILSISRRRIARI